MDTSRNQVVLKMIPRIDYSTSKPEGGGKKKRRAPAKFFDLDLIRYCQGGSCDWSHD